MPTSLKLCRCQSKADLPTERWFPALFFFLVIGLLIRSPFLIALPLTVGVVLGVAHLWQKHALDEVFYRRRFHYTRGFPGETFPVRLEFENHKLLPISWLRIQDPWPRAVGPQDENVLAPSHAQELGFLMHVFSLRWFERTRRTYELLLRKRGSYHVGPAQLESGDLFGIYANQRQSGSPEKLVVFPALLPQPGLQFPPDNPYGDQRSRRRLFEDPTRPMGVREYHPEDGFRRVHWPATARIGELQVKVHQPTSARVMVLCLNVSTYHRYWEGVYPALLEHTLSMAASLLLEGIQSGYRVGLVSNGCLSNSDQPFRILPGRSPDQLAHLLEALAGVTPVVVAPFDRFLLREAARLPYGATLVVLTAIINQDLPETLVQLRKHERRINLISLAKEAPPQIPGVRTLHLPFRDPNEPPEPVPQEWLS